MTAGPAATGSPFGRRALVVLGVLGGVGLTAMLLYAIFGERSASGNSYASLLRRSAVGYRALVELVDDDVEIEPGQGFYPANLGPGEGLLILDPTDEQVAELTTTVSRAMADRRPVVLVLPKWFALPHPVRSGWVGTTFLRETDEVQAALVAALGEGAQEGLEVVRPESLAAPLAGTTELGEELTVELPRPQLLADRVGYFQPLIGDADGMLVGRAESLPLWVVADPDLLNNAGLGQGGNAVAAYRLLVDEVGQLGYVVLEGTFGALPPVDSLWSALLRPPLAVVTWHLALIAALAAWAGLGRFGRALAVPPRVVPGKRTLVDNTALLLATAGDPGHALERYLRLIAERAGERLGLPPQLAADERARRLDRIAAARGVSISFASLAAAAGRLPPSGAARGRHALDLAVDLHRWYQEVCDGPLRDR